MDNQRPNHNPDPQTLVALNAAIAAMETAKERLDAAIARHQEAVDLFFEVATRGDVTLMAAALANAREAGDLRREALAMAEAAVVVAEAAQETHRQYSKQN